MPWFKIDDQLHSHMKWRACSKGARALWATAGSWCAGQANDGHIPGFALSMLDGTRREANELVNADLWEPHPDGDGWVFHDWLEYQPSSETVVEKRRKEREKKRRQRAAGSSNRASNGTFTGRMSPGDTTGDRPGDSRHGPPGTPSVPDPDPDPQCENPPPTNGGTRPTGGGGDPSDLARAIATHIADQQPAGTIRNRPAWITRKTSDLTTHPHLQRHHHWLTTTNPNLPNHQHIAALASRLEDGHWPTYVTPDPTPPPAWAGLPGEDLAPMPSTPAAGPHAQEDLEQ